jgi:hypothetical protein
MIRLARLKPRVSFSKTFLNVSFGRRRNHLRPLHKPPEDPVFFPMLKIVVMSAATSALVASPVQLFAQVDDTGNFTEGDLGAPPNSDSESVPGLVMHQPSYSGTGCPGGSASAVLSPDGKTLSVLFDSYVAEAGNHVGTARVAKGCQLNIPFSVPTGYAVQVVKMDYRGFTALPAGSRSTFGAGFRFLEINGRTTAARRVLRANVMVGPRSENFTLTSMIPRSEFSPCGQNFLLAAESHLNVQSNRAGEQALSTVDSLDAVQTPVKYSLRWIRCETGRVPGRVEPDRPPRPPVRPPIRPPRFGR